MNTNISGNWSRGRIACMLSAAIIIGVSGITLSAKSDESQEGPAGAWGVQVTIRDCATHAPLGPPFNSLVTRHQGGTANEDTSAPFAIGQRTSGHGTWTHTTGHTFRQRIVNLILFDTAPNLPGTPTFDPRLPVSPGLFAGWTVIDHSVVMSDADHTTSDGTLEFFKSNGDKYMTGCSTTVGERIE